MPETTFEMLPPEVQEEVRQVSVDLGWSLCRATDEYLEMGKSLAIQAQLKQMKRKAPVLALAGHKKGLDRG